MNLTLNFGSLEALLAEVHGIASDKRTAFQARLKNFLRLGLLEGAKAGRGKAAQFSLPMVLNMAVAMELAQLGRTPERIVQQMNRTKASLAGGFRAAIDSAANEGDDVVFVFFTKDVVLDQAEDTAVSSYTLRLSQFDRITRPGGFLSAVPRAGLINISKVYRAVADYILKHSLAATDEIEADVEEWHEAFHKEPLTPDERDRHNRFWRAHGLDPQA